MEADEKVEKNPSQFIAADSDEDEDSDDEYEYEMESEMVSFVLPFIYLYTISI